MRPAPTGKHIASVLEPAALAHVEDDRSVARANTRNLPSCELAGPLLTSSECGRGRTSTREVVSGFPVYRLGRYPRTLVFTPLLTRPRVAL
jgi:hypothetical protein